jgi:site-specific recombinase XerD
MLNISEYIREYINHLEINKQLSFNSLRLYKRDLLEFEEFIIANYGLIYDFKSLNDQILNKFSQSIIKSGRTIATANRKLTAVHGLWTWLRENGEVSRDPFTQIHREAQYRNKAPNFLSEDEIVLLLDCEELDLKTKMILEIIYATGIRVGELTQLTIEDIDLDNQIITIPRSSRSKERSIPFNQLLTQFITKHVEINQLSKNSKLLLNRRGEQVSEREVFRLIREAAKKAGIRSRVSPSIIRNSFIKHMKENGAHDTLLRDITGQKNVLV